MRKRRARQRRRAVMAGMIILTVLAVAGGGVAFLKQQEAERQTAEGRIGEGRYYLELARNERRHPDAQILAARAIAFEAYGRPSGKNFGDCFWDENPTAWADPPWPLWSFVGKDCRMRRSASLQTDREEVSLRLA